MNQIKFSCPVCESPVSAKNSLCAVCGAIYTINGMTADQIGHTCFLCGTQTDGTPKSCSECGKDYSIECPKCGHEYPIGSSTCEKCGFKNADHQDLDSNDQDTYASFKPTATTGWLKKGLILFGVMGALFYLMDHIDWEGPQAFGGFFIILLVMSLVVMYVIYSPSFGITARANRDPGYARGRFAMVYRTLDLSRADHLAAVLKGEDIPAFVYNRHATTLDPFNVFSGIRVMVPCDRLDEVVKVMDAFGFETQDVQKQA
jgi:hypothetical protein